VNGERQWWHSSVALVCTGASTWSLAFALGSSSTKFASNSMCFLWNGFGVCFCVLSLVRLESTAGVPSDGGNGSVFCVLQRPNRQPMRLCLTKNAPNPPVQIQARLGSFHATAYFAPAWRVKTARRFRMSCHGVWSLKLLILPLA